MFVTRAAQFVMLLFTSYDWYWPLPWQHCIFRNIWNCLIIIILVKSAEYLYLQWCTTCHVRNIYCSNSFEEDQTKNIFTPRIFILSCDHIHAVKNTHRSQSKRSKRSKSQLAKPNVKFLTHFVSYLGLGYKFFKTDFCI